MENIYIYVNMRDICAHVYGIRRSLIVVGSITEVKQRRARFIIVWVMGNNWMGVVYTRGAQRTT